MQPTTTDRKVLDNTGFNELTISVSANNKVNLGSYESADRSVFLTKKLRLAADATMQEEHAIFENETRRLQSLADCELARITAMFCNELDAQTHRDKVGIFTKVHKAFSIKARLAFGIEVKEIVETRANLPAKGVKGVVYVIKDTGEEVQFNGKAYAPATA